MTRSRLTVVCAGLLVGAVALAGCASDDDTADDTAAPTATEAVSPTSSPEASPAATPETTVVASLDAIGAVTTALNLVPGGAALEGGQTDEQSREVWYVLVRDADGAGTELYLDRETGELVAQEPEDVPDIAQGELPALTALDGLQAALGAVPGTEVEEFDLDTENGATVWAVLVAGADGATEVYVDANTGAIVKQERAD